MPKYRVRRELVVQPLNESYRLIPLTCGQVAIVDAEDFDRLNQHNWHAAWSVNNRSFYAKTHIGRRLVDMSHFIIDVPRGYVPDHISQITLDYRKTNLRVATFGQNRVNGRKRHDVSSRFRGVGFHKASGKWRAYLKVPGEDHSIHLGVFSSEEEAARARDKAASALQGNFAIFNLS